MKNKLKAIYDVLGLRMKQKSAGKFFFNVFRFFLYHDTRGFLEALEFKARVGKQNKWPEDYVVFRYMLKLLLKRHPQKLTTLCPDI